MFKHIIKPIALFIIGKEEFFHKREPDYKNVEDTTTWSLMFVLTLMELPLIFLITYPLGFLHTDLAIEYILPLLMIYVNLWFAKRILSKPQTSHKMSLLYLSYASLPMEQRRYFYSWRHLFIKLSPILIITTGIFIIELWLTPAIDLT